MSSGRNAFVPVRLHINVRLCEKNVRSHSHIHMYIILQSIMQYSNNKPNLIHPFKTYHFREKYNCLISTFIFRLSGIYVLDTFLVWLHTCSVICFITYIDKLETGITFTILSIESCLCLIFLTLSSVVF